MRFEAKCLPRDAGPAGWNRLLDVAPSCPPLDQHKHADIAIIGAGFAGLSAAMRLVEHDPTVSVIVLEASQLGEGPVGRNSGFMIDLPHDLSSDDYAGSSTDLNVTRLNRYAIDQAKDWAKRHQFPAEAINPIGKINGAATRKGMVHNQTYADHLAEIGEACDILDERDMRNLTGSSYYLNGLYTPGTVLLQPALWARSLVKTLVKIAPDKCTVHCETPVRSIARKGDDWHLDCPQGSVTAAKVIMATNGHVESFGLFRRQLVHIMLYGSISRALTEEESRTLGGEDNWGITPADPMGTTVRKFTGTGGQRLIVRNQASYTPSLDITDAKLRKLTRRHRLAFENRFPNLSSVTMEHSWGGRLCLSLNDVPAFGEVEPGLIAACCQNGLGTTKGTLSGLFAADLILGKTSEELSLWQEQDAPKKLPIEPFASLGARTTLAWRQWQAGKEV